MTADAGSITLQAGDNLTTAVGSLISATGTVTVGGDFEAAVNPIGKLIQLLGVINATSATITSGSANDKIEITNIAVGTPTTIEGGGNDIITIGSTTGTGGALNRIANSLTIMGGANGNSSLLVDDTGDATNTTGTLSTILGDEVLVGLGMGVAGVIKYVEIAAAQIALGNGSDIFNVQGTLAGTSTTIKVGSNGNTVRVGGPNGNLTDTVNAIQGFLTVTGNGTNTVLNVIDAGETRATTGILNNGRLTGLGMGSSDPTTVNSAAGLQVTGVTDLNVMLGSGADNFTVGSISNLTTINTGTGGDTVTVGLSTGTNGLTEINALLLIRRERQRQRSAHRAVQRQQQPYARQDEPDHRPRHGARHERQSGAHRVRRRDDVDRRPERCRSCRHPDDRQYRNDDRGRKRRRRPLHRGR